MNDLIERLQNTANKLRMMWGANPDSVNIEEAIKALSTEPEELSASMQLRPVKRQSKG